MDIVEMVLLQGVLQIEQCQSSDWLLLMNIKFLLAVCKILLLWH